MNDTKMALATILIAFSGILPVHAVQAERTQQTPDAHAEKRAGAATPSAAASRSAASETAARVQARYDETETLSGRFVQEVALGSSGRKLRSAGTMRFRKPGLMRWEYEGPEPQTLIADGKTLWIHQPADKQVLRAPLSRAFESQTPVSFLFGVARLDRDFVPALLPPAANGALRLSLVAQASDGSPSRLVLEVDPATFDLRAAEVTDVLGNSTRVELVDVQRNLSLDDALFAFERPPGTDVIATP
jgi:outer membrane lipoprotein carrier protein